MRNNKDFEEFLKLKIIGKKQVEISEILHISEQTVCKWNAELREQIREKRIDYINTLLDYYLNIEFEEYVSVIKLRKELFKELLGREYTNISIKEILSILELLDTKIEYMKKEVMRESPIFGDYKGKILSNYIEEF